MPKWEPTSPLDEPMGNLEEPKIEAFANEEIKIEKLPEVIIKLDDPTPATAVADLGTGAFGAATMTVAVETVTCAEVPVNVKSSGSGGSYESQQSVMKWSQSDQPLGPVQVILIFSAIVIPNVTVIVCLSAMGIGLDVFDAVADLSLIGDAMLSGACLFGALLLIFDWWRMPFFWKVFTGLLPVISFCIGSVFKGRRYPWASMLLCLFFMPALLGLIRVFLCKEVKRSKFYGAIAASTFFCAVTIGVTWAIYVLNNKWDTDTKIALANKVPNVYKHVYTGAKKDLFVKGEQVLFNGMLEYGIHCGPTRNETMIEQLDKEDVASIDKACNEASTLWFLCWMCPFIAIGCDFVVTIFCLVTGVVGQVDAVSAIQRTLTRFVLIIAFLLTGMYACATFSATSIRLGSTLMAFFVAAIAILCVWIYLEIDLDVLATAASHSKLMQQLVAVAKSDWTRAIAVGALGGPIIMFFILNYLTNSARKCRGAAGDAASDRFTPMGRRFINTLSPWNWTSICLKIIMLGELFFTLQVGVAKVTYIFLSWLNVSLEDTKIEIVSVLIFFIGGSMFLLPPVPGLPVYVFAGILLGEKGRQTEEVGFWGGCAIASVLGLFTKLVACTGQYMIGYYLGKSIKVQQLIGVDQVPTRAIEKILKSRGLNLGKVSVLVGGPDWPTSVTCGIVGVNIPQMLLGTLPVVGLLVPCVLAGACMGRVTPGEQSDWNMLANCFTLFAGGVNMVAMAYAVYMISQTVQNHGEELAKPRPEHEVVAELTKKEQAEMDCYRNIVAWNNLSSVWRCTVLFSTVGMLMSNMIFVGMAEMCFRTFAVSSKIKDPFEKNGLEGNVFNIIHLPIGVGALAMFVVALILHLVFVKAMARKTAQRMKSDD